LIFYSDCIARLEGGHLPAAQPPALPGLGPCRCAEAMVPHAEPQLERSRCGTRGIAGCASLPDEIPDSWGFSGSEFFPSIKFIAQQLATAFGCPAERSTVQKTVDLSHFTARAGISVPLAFENPGREIHPADCQMVTRSPPNAWQRLLREAQSYRRLAMLTQSFLPRVIARACTAAKTPLYFHLYPSLVIGVDERNGGGWLKSPSPRPLAVVSGLQKPITLSHCDSSRGRNTVQKCRTQDIPLLQHVLWYPVSNVTPTFRERGRSFCVIQQGG